MPKPIGMAEMNGIFRVLDDLGISREAVTVPLAPSGAGSVERLPGGKLRIVLPETTALDEWLPVLHARLRELLSPGPGA